MNTMEEPKTEQKFETKLYPMIIEGYKFTLMDKMRSEEESRFALQMLHKIKGSWYATDGRRAVKIDNCTDELPDGVYNIESSKKTKSFVEYILRSMDLESPSFSQVWLINTVRVGSLLFNDESLNLTKSVLDIFTLTKRAVNVAFLKDLQRKPGEVWDILVNPGEEENSEKPIILKNGDIEVIILPFRYTAKQKEVSNA